MSGNKVKWVVLSGQICLPSHQTHYLVALCPSFEDFLPEPSGPATQQKTFLVSQYIQRLAKNPLFEVISLLVPTGPLKIKNIQETDSIKLDIFVTH
jgi:hypothetical protein